jgi:glycosyltransferase involved in cell wall biosynthesis
VTDRTIAPLLRRWDRAISRSVDDFVANSTAIAQRIGDAYSRNATVIHPPVDTRAFLRTPRRTQDYLLAFGRLVPYKRFDLAVAAAERLRMPLLVAGEGPERPKLEALNSPHVRFLGRVSDERYVDLLAGARALVFPGEEDFGIVPVEALAAGVPVVAYAAGGVLDTITGGSTGELFDEQSAAAAADAIQRCVDRTWDTDLLRSAAEQYSSERFKDRFRQHVLSAPHHGSRPVASESAGDSNGAATRANAFTVTPLQ